MKKEKREMAEEERGRIPEERSKKRGRAKYVLGALAFVLMGFLGGWLGGYYSVDARARSLAWMVDRVAENYFQDIDKDTLYDMLFDSLELDRFCTHYTPDEYAQVRSESEGNNVGYGLSVSALEEGIRIYRVVQNSPAERAGLRSGMYIRRFGADEEHLKAGTRQEMMDFLSGVQTAVFACGFEEDGSDERLITVTRGAYSAAYCTYIDSEFTYRFRGEGKTVLTQCEGGMSELGADTAYIRLDQFEGNAAAEFQACLALMKSCGRQNLVLDLRSDGGGYLSILCEIASHLLKNAEGNHPLIATAKYRSGRTSKYRATGNDYATYFSADSQIRVLADENTASASESLIGAMVDYGTIDYSDIYLRVCDDGTAHSFGKGVMQSTYVAPSGDALRLTVAQIFWPKGRSIHGTGVRAEDGANAIEAPLLPNATDSFLQQLLG